MKALAATFLAALLSAAVVPGLARAENRLDWKSAGRTDAAATYPYKNLPGVKDPAKQPVDEKFSCRTATAYPRWWRGIYYRGLPQLVYVCDQNGVISSSTHAPNWSYWQYNDRNR